MSALDPHFLRTFRKAFELQNFTKTAETLHMTQSGVSQHVAQLEDVLGQRLFERVGRTVVPTSLGASLYEFGGQWLESMQDFVGRTRNEDASIERVRVGCPGSFGTLLLPVLIERHLPGGFFVELGPNHVIERMLRRAELDAGVVTEAPDARFFDAEAFFEEEYVLFGHPSLLPPSPTLNAVLAMPLVDFPGSGPILRRWFGAFYPGSETRLHEITMPARINNMEGVVDIVRGRRGISILPRHVIEKALAGGDLEILRPDDCTSVRSTLYLVSRRGSSNSRHVTMVSDLLRAAKSGPNGPALMVV